MARQRRADHLTARAKRENYPARSIYKLEEIDRRIRLLRQGQAVLDLGAAPGSWTLYASKQVGMSGRVVSIDLAEIAVALPRNVIALTLDVLALSPDQARAASGEEAFDVVLSDMAPSTSGDRIADQQRSLRLFLSGLELAGALLRSGGSFVGKIFQSEDLDLARKRVRDLFDEEKIIRPRGTRSESTELFVVGVRRRPEAGGVPGPW